jgi:alanyl-tRNA synthetase
MPTFQTMRRQPNAETNRRARGALEKVDADVREWEKKTPKAAEADLKSMAPDRPELSRNPCDKNSVAESADAMENPSGSRKEDKNQRPIFLAGTRDASVALVAHVPAAMTAKFQANKLIQQIAPIVGGKGGGRPESAQGAGKDASKVNEALAKARELLLGRQ